MSTPARPDLEISSQTAHLVDTDTESNLEEAPSEPSNIRITSSHSSASSDSTAPLSPDHPLTQASPTPTPTRVSFHHRTARMVPRTQHTLSPGMSGRIVEATALSLSSFYKRVHLIILDTKTEDESSDLNAERKGHYLDDKGHGLDEEGHSLDDEGQGLKDMGPGLEEEEEAAPEGQQQAVPVMYTTASEPLGLGYGVLRSCELALGEGSVPSTFETPPSLECSSGSLPISPSSTVVPSPIASLVTTPAATISVDKDQFLEVAARLELYRSILHDHTQQLDALPPTLFKGYDRILRELNTRLILALRAWAGQTDAQRAALWHVIYDIQRENHDLRRWIAMDRHERLKLTDRVARMEMRLESRGE
ncbi:hypothetical protein Tco_0195336 [Tanacetum coccineum]